MTDTKIKSIVSDLDGTLLDSKGCLSDVTIDILNSLHRRNFNIIIATGRLYPDSIRALKKLKFTPAIISCNGAALHDSESADLLVSFYIKKPLTFEAIKYSSEFKLHITLFCNDTWYVLEENPSHKDYVYQSGLDAIKIDINSISTLNVNKILLNGPPEFTSHHYTQLIHLFKSKANLCRTSSSDIEIMPKNISKYTTLDYYLNTLDLDSGSCLAFGDALNDVEMLSSVGEGVLMENAKLDVVNLLPTARRTSSNQDNGVARYLAKKFNIDLPIS